MKKIRKKNNNIYAIYKNANISTQKLNIITKNIMNMHVQKAIDFLSFTNKKAAKIILKVLNSALSNAEHNNNVDIDNLKIKKILINKGIYLKRISFRARGRSDRILKKRSHITIYLKKIKR